MQEKKQRFIDQTLDVWQPRTSSTLTHEDARQIAENVTGFFRILLEWQAAERKPSTLIDDTEGKLTTKSVFGGVES